MAVTPDELFAEAKCVSCLGPVDAAQTMRVALLLRIAEALGSTVNIQELLDSAACAVCLPGVSQADAVEIALLQEIADSITGGSGISLASFFQEGNYAGGEPTWTPTGDVGLAIDTSTTPGTQWTYYSGAWH